MYQSLPFYLCKCLIQGYISIKEAFSPLSRFSHTLKKWAVLVALNDCTLSMLARLHQSTIAGLQRLARTKGGGGIKETP